MSYRSVAHTSDEVNFALYKRAHHGLLVSPAPDHAKP